MAQHHQLADPLIPLRRQRFGRLGRPEVLADHMPAAAIDQVAQMRTGGFNLFHGDIAQGPHLWMIAPEDRHCLLALLAA